MKKPKKRMKFNTKIESFFRWPIVYWAIIAGLTVLAMIENYKLGVIFTIVFILSSICGFLIILYTKKRLMTEVINFALNYDIVNKTLTKKFETPYILLDESGKLHWYNDAFENLCEDNKKLLNRNINAIIPALNANNLPEENKEFEKIIEIKENIYRVLIKYILIEEDENNTVHKNIQKQQVLYVAYFFDITKEYELEIENDEQKAVVGLLYIDNYDEVVHSIEEVRRPLLVALIDRNINKFAKRIDAVIRKFEKDKYMIIFQKKYLEVIKDDKFNILDKIREINIGNEIPVTLSIGIGFDAYSYSQQIDYARIAIDLALGRGGDQAVIKDNDKLSFYGGKTRGVEKSTRVKARVKAHAFRELLEECDRVLVMGHRLQDMDSLGASIGIYACAKHFEKPAHIIINDITTSVKPLYDLLTSHEEYPTDVFVNGQESLAYVSEHTLLVMVDVNRPSYLDYPDILKHIKNTVVFDHHRVGAEYIEDAVISYVEPYASSTCEMVTEIIRYISDRVKLNPLEADALFAGITVDTKNFAVKAGVKTFEAAAFLRRNGADVVRVRKMFKNDMASYKAKATAVRDAEIYRENIAISICPSDTTNPNLVGAQAADELLNIAGIKASFVLTEVGDTIYISSRSLDDINVQLIMEKLGGGGHLSVAGAQLVGYTLTGAIEILKDTVDEYIKEGEN